MNAHHTLAPCRIVRTPRGHAIAFKVRPPMRKETPLSDAEVWHGFQRGLLAKANGSAS